MLANGQIVGDGSWNLRVLVTGLQIERLIRVKGDLHIGGVLLRLVEVLEIIADWSDHALWWPERNMWLSKTRFTLDQYGVHADASLHFTPMHKPLRVQLPDLRYIDVTIDFSIKTFSAVAQLCKHLGIRHPEELSFCKPLEHQHLKSNYKYIKKGGTGNNEDYYNEYNSPNRYPKHNTSADTNIFIANSSSDGSTGSLERTGYNCAPSTRMTSTPTNFILDRGSLRDTSNASLISTNSDHNGDNYGNNNSLAQTPPLSSAEARRHLVRPRSLVEKARMNAAWLDSSLSIMEQDIRECDTLWLRFKFYVFYDLNPKCDAIRINQIYEQAKNQLLNDEIDCTEEEMLMFASLQLQVNLQANQPQAAFQYETGGNAIQSGDDDIDAALTDLQTTLEGSNVGMNDVSDVPELYDQMRFLKPKRFTLKSYKLYWFTYRDFHLYLYPSREEMIHRTNPIHHINLKGCEVSPDVRINQNRYIIKLDVPSAEGMTEMYIRCDDEHQYAKWMACCRLASKGRSISDSSYETEKQSILDVLSMQRPAEEPTVVPNSIDIDVQDYIAPRLLRKFRGKTKRILKAHANVKNLSLIDAKMNYIKAWQSLPDYGITLFVIKIMGNKKEELLAVAHNRIMKMDINNGDLLNTWHYNTLKAWNVNWEVKHMMVQFEEGNIVFSCLSADCKVVHEFIGGYIFLSTRSKGTNQSLNEELFHKLTGGWS